MLIVHTDTDDLDNPMRGGQPVRTYEVNSRLSQRHRITVLTATYPRCERRVVRGSLTYTRLGFGVPGLGLSRHLTFLALLGNTVRRTSHDLIVEEFTPPIGFCLLPLWTKKPVVSVVQWFFFQDWEQRYKLPFEHMMRSTPRHMSYRNFIVQTERMGDYFRELVPLAHVWKVPCGIADDAFSPASGDSAGDYALFLGRLDIHHKGLDYLVDTWERLLSAGETIPLRIAGAGPGINYLQTQISRRNLSHLVELLGRVEGAAKQALLKQCRFLVMPSRHETFGMTALEAMAVAKPVLGFDIAHLNEVLNPQCARLVPLGSVEELAAEAAALWHNPGQCLALGKRAYEKAQRYRWDELARIQEAVYQEIVAQGTRE
ncbi:MAG: glycosyltransferase family 4 protein [Rhizomicrobium sp.]